MPKKTDKTIVTNTSLLIALVAAWGTLEPLVDRMQKKGIRLGRNIIQFATMQDQHNGKS